MAANRTFGLFSHMSYLPVMHDK